MGATLGQVVVDLEFSGVDADNPDKQIIHRGKIKSMAPQKKGWLRWRQAIEPAIEHFKSDNRVDRYWLQGASGDPLQTIGCTAGYNLRWLLRAIARLGIQAFFSPVTICFTDTNGRRIVIRHSHSAGKAWFPQLSIWFGCAMSLRAHFRERVVCSARTENEFFRDDYLLACSSRPHPVIVFTARHKSCHALAFSDGLRNR